MRVRIEGYICFAIKTLQTSYNIGVQANCKAKGVKTMAQKVRQFITYKMDVWVPHCIYT